MKQRAPRDSSRAVVLLEVLVALTLLAGSGVVALSWVQQSLESVSRVQRSQLESQLLRNALASIAVVNPAIERFGRIEQPGLRLEWTSRQVEPMQSIFVLGLEGRIANPPWQVGIFELDVRAQSVPSMGSSQQEATSAVMFTVRSIGHKPTRPLTGGRP